jgi:shikimate kinase
MNILLIGMRGSGKTTIGQSLASRLGYTFIDSDKELVARVGKTIPSIVKESGWDKFRDYESSILKSVCEKDTQVIATGGGVILRSENVNIMKKAGSIVWLTAPVDELIERIGEDTNRPSLTNADSIKEEMEHVLSERSQLYKCVADQILNTHNKSIHSVTKEIVDVYPTGLINKRHD